MTWSPNVTFSRFWVKDEDAWNDEDMNRAFYRFECENQVAKRNGSVHHLFHKRYRREPEKLEMAYVKAYGEPLKEGRRLKFVRLTRRIAGRDEVIFLFFKLKSEIQRIERGVFVRSIMEA